MEKLAVGELPSDTDVELHLKGDTEVEVVSVIPDSEHKVNDVPLLIARNTTVDKEWATVHLLSALTKMTTELKQRDYDMAEQAALQPITDASKMSAAQSASVFSPPGSPGAPPPPALLGIGVPDGADGAGAAEEGGGSAVDAELLSQSLKATVERQWRHQQQELPNVNLKHWVAVYTGTPMHTGSAEAATTLADRDSLGDVSLRPRSPTMSAQEEFGKVYHELIHSAALVTLLGLEQTFAAKMEALVDERDTALERLGVKQMRGLDRAMASLGAGVTDTQINSLTEKHTLELQKMENHYESELEILERDQKRDYLEFVRGVHAAEQSKAGEAGGATSAAASPSHQRRGSGGDGDGEGRGYGAASGGGRGERPGKGKDSIVGGGIGGIGASFFGRRKKKNSDGARGGAGSGGTFAPAVVREEPSADAELPAPAQRLEESFTVHLGTQMKTMHNLRLVAAESIDLCKVQVGGGGGDQVSSSRFSIQAERLAAAMSLYSDALSGMVLIVDNRLSNYTGVKREFAQLCERSTEFHFPSLAEQMQQLKVDLQTSSENPAAAVAAASAASAGSPAALKTGEFYLTRHSTLPGYHAVFHLVGDAETASSEFSARSASMLGIRNLMRCAFQTNINQLTIPLLLVHTLTDEMDSRWCLRRAEPVTAPPPTTSLLVLKCLKGFVMENSTGPSAVSKDIQFLVPKDTAEELFDAYSKLFAQIFRVSSVKNFQS